MLTWNSTNKQMFIDICQHQIGFSGYRMLPELPNSKPISEMVKFLVILSEN